MRKDFPILDREVRPGVPLVYLDNAATSQKPTQVLDAMRDYYERHNANVHRGIHTLAEEATALYEGGREKVAAFINAASPAEVVFTKNSSEALNLLAHVLPFGAGDEVVVTEMEHHSNLVPWQMACQRTGATLKWIGLTDDGRLDLADLDRVITPRTKVVSFVHQSNLLGTVNPVDVGRRQGAQRRRARRARRLAVGAAHGRRRAGARRRRGRLHRPQDARSDRHRRALGAARACSRSGRRSSAAAR